MSDLIYTEYSTKNNKIALNRRNFLKFGVFAFGGLAISHLIHKDKEAEAVAPALIYAALFGITAFPYAKNAFEHYLQGNVDATNESGEPKQGYVKVTVLDNSQHYNVSGFYGPYFIPPYSNIALPYSGIVPNGTGPKYIHAESYIDSTPYYDFDWNY